MRGQYEHRGGGSFLSLVHNVTGFAEAEARLIGSRIGAILQSDDRITFLGRLVQRGVVDLAPVAKAHSGLRRNLVGARLQPDDAISLFGSLVHFDVRDEATLKFQ